MPQKPRNASWEDPLGRSTSRVVLGPARPFRTPMYLVERCKNSKGWKGVKFGVVDIF
jgi:hypothetical protein